MYGQWMDDDIIIINQEIKNRPIDKTTAVACPVCYGKGFVPEGFYCSTRLTWASNGTGNETCRSCSGKGYIKL